MNREIHLDCEDGKGKKLSALDNQIIDGSIENLGINELMLWEMRNFVYAKLKNNPTLMEVNTNENSVFLNNFSETNIGDFYTLEQQVTDAIIPNENTQTNLLNLYDETKSLLLYLKIINNQLINNPNNENILSEHTNISTNLVVNQEDINTNLANINEIKTEKLRNALSFNNTIEVSKDYELYLKIVNNFWIRHLLEEVFQESSLKHCCSLPKYGRLSCV